MSHATFLLRKDQFFSLFWQVYWLSLFRNRMTKLQVVVQEARNRVVIKLPLFILTFLIMFRILLLILFFLVAHGDLMKLQIKLYSSTRSMIESKFKTFGCWSAITSSSVATEQVKVKNVDDILVIKNTDISNHLKLSPVK